MEPEHVRTDQGKWTRGGATSGQDRGKTTLFKPVDEDGRRDHIKAELKWMANLLGEARDLDVCIAKVLEPARAQHENDESYKQLLADYAERRDRAYRMVQETIASPRFINGVLETAAWIQAGGWVVKGSKVARRRRGKPVAELAEEEIGRRWKRVLKRGRNLAGLDPECCVPIIRMVITSIGILLLIATVLLLMAALPAWPYNRGWDSRPSISFGLLILMILMLLGTGPL